MFDLATFITGAGYVGLFIIIFAESGLLIGFFLPGDSLLFTAGLLASQGLLNIYVLVIGCFLAAVIGDSVGYAFGRRFGPSIFSRPKSIFFNPQHVERAKNFYDAHGGKTIILARFIPIVRTIAPILAGVGNMTYRTFFIYNLSGGLIWAVGVTCAGYFLGSWIPNIDAYLTPIILLIVFTSILPGITAVLKNKSSRQQFIDNTKKIFNKIFS